VPEAVTDDLRRAGLGHLSAVSGANVAVVLLTVLLVARWCGVRGSPLMVTGLGAVAFFAIVARAEPSVLRASVMAVVVLLSASRGGRAGAVPSLAATVLILLLIDPSLATSIGFVLSTVATAGLVVLAPHLFGASVKVERESWPARARRATRDALRVTLAAQLAVAPVLIAMSGRLDLGGVVANLLAAPAVPFATVVGLASGGLSFVHPVLATAAATVAAWPAEWIVLVGERVAASPWARLPWPDGPVGAGVFVLLAAVVATWVRWRRHPRRAASSLPRPPGRPLALALVMTALASTVLVGAPVDAHRRWPPAGWRVVMCDVGQGDATVLDLGGGAAILVDAGPDGRQIDRCLRDLGVVFLPLIVLTHFHADHIAGLRGAVRGRKVGTVLTTDLAEPRAGADDVQVVVRERSLPVVVARAGRSAAVGPWRLRVLAPSRADDSEGSAANNASVVLRADHPDLSVLLLGDVERSAQEQLLRVASAAVTDVDVVKVAHHGSASQVPALMTIAHPRIALIGVGCDNTYGHPTATVLKLLASTHSTVGRTDRSGDLAVTSTADGRVELMARGAAPTLGPASRCL
jgi:competence protein ComEC